MKEKYRALLVDDEDSSIRLLKKLLQETLFFNDIRSAQSVDMAVAELNNFEPDIIFLDIKMPGKDGFEFINDLKQNDHNAEVVFVTAYDQYAIKAIKNHAFDYLLKPVNRKELRQCVLGFIKKRKIVNNSAKKGGSLQSSDKITRIRVNTRTGTLFINPASILYCKAEGNYTSICTGEKHHLCSMNLGKIHDILPGNKFVRLGRSFIINFEFITLLDRKESTITLSRDGEEAIVKIPRQHLKDLDIM